MTGSRMERICCIILNYNDAPTTMGLVKELEKSGVLSHIVVVDNHSADDSWRQLHELQHSGGQFPGEQYPGQRFDGCKPGQVPVFCIRTEKNGGYGSGNQVGIDYASERLAPDYIVIANPDIHVSDECLSRVKEALDKSKTGAVASAMVVSPGGQPLFSYWNLLPLWKELLDTGLITRRIFKGWLSTPLWKLKIEEASDEQGKTEKNGNASANVRQVGAVPGSFFMIKMGCFTSDERKNLFDKQVFLYCEEKILGQKVKEKGLTELLVTDASYVHAHSVSIDKSISRIGDKQRLLHESKLYYFKNYLHAGPWKMAAARTFLAAVLAEVRFLTEVLRMRW